MTVVMNVATKRALEKSIKKWQKIVVAFDEDPKNPKYDWPDASNCPLCAMFNACVIGVAPKHIENSCAGCPIALTSGKPFCESTPYMDFRGGSGKQEMKTAQTMVDYMVEILDKAIVKARVQNRIE